MNAAQEAKMSCVAPEAAQEAARSDSVRLRLVPCGRKRGLFSRHLNPPSLKHSDCKIDNLKADPAKEMQESGVDEKKNLEEYKQLVSDSAKTDRTTKEPHAGGPSFNWEDDLLYFIGDYLRTAGTWVYLCFLVKDVPKQMTPFKRQRTKNIRAFIHTYGRDFISCTMDKEGHETVWFV